MKKPQARILDATAGNRTMWKTKESEYVIWIDIEEDLEFTPDFFMDNTNTEFEDNYFYMIMFDHPNIFGTTKNANIFSTPSRTTFGEKWPQHNTRRFPRYYGSDKYKTKTDLLKFVSRAQEEFHRILWDGGCLWVKWNECEIPLKEVLPLFINWDLMMSHYGIPPNQTSQTRTFWLMFMKKHNGPKQETL